MRPVKLMFAATLFWVAGCATTGSTSSPQDPFEGFNRTMFRFNLGLDRIILEPTAKGYRAVTTDSMRDGVSNALANLREPVTAANQILQGDLVDAGETVGRFALNTTIGVGGFVDVAGHYGHERAKEDFGQTLGVWGVPSGPYLVLPILGSSNPRDLAGSGVDSAFQPLNWAEFDDKTEILAARSVLGLVSGREAAIEQVEQLREQLDPYTAVRRIYVQSRESAIRNGAPDPSAYENLPDYDEYDDY